MVSTDPNTTPVSVADLMAKVGHFVFYWSALEQALAFGIDEANERLGNERTKIRGSTKERVERWFDLALRLPENEGKRDVAERVRDQVIQLVEVRNLIIHGLQAGEGRNLDGEASIRCAVGGYDAPTGNTVSYTINELDDFTSRIDACRRALDRLDYFNLV